MVILSLNTNFKPDMIHLFYYIYWLICGTTEWIQLSLILPHPKINLKLANLLKLWQDINIICGTGVTIHFINNKFYQELQNCKKIYSGFWLILDEAESNKLCQIAMAASNSRLYSVKILKKSENFQWISFNAFE